MHGAGEAAIAAGVRRIEAVEFAVKNDDGAEPRNLPKADLVLVGISRTSKTPTCIYLANRGIKAANVPFVPGCPLPPELEQITRPLVVGLTKDPDRLIQIRRRFRQELVRVIDPDPTYVNDVDNNIVFNEVKITDPTNRIDRISAGLRMNVALVQLSAGADFNLMPEDASGNRELFLQFAGRAGLYF